MYKRRTQQRKIRAIIKLLDKLSNIIMALIILGYFVFIIALIAGAERINTGMNILEFMVSLWMLSMGLLISASTVSCKSLILSISRVIISFLGLYSIVMAIITDRL